jgi:hypothetical protein
VMGGACQATWEHAVPKVARGAGPRISASIRWAAGAGGAEQEWAPHDRRVTGRSEPPRRRRPQGRPGRRPGYRSHSCWVSPERRPLPTARPRRRTC